MHCVGKSVPDMAELLLCFRKFFVRIAGCGEHPGHLADQLGSAGFVKQSRLLGGKDGLEMGLQIVYIAELHVVDHGQEKMEVQGVVGMQCKAKF